MKREFINLNFMYYTNYQDGNLVQPYGWKLSPEYHDLDMQTKRKVSIGGSVLAFLFTSLTYIFKGLFLKGLIFSIIIFTVAYFLPEQAICGVSLLFAWFFGRNFKKIIFMKNV